MPDFDFDSERDQRWIDFYDGEALDLMQGWWGGQDDPIYAIASSGGNYAWVFEDAIANLNADIARVKKIGRNKYQLGRGTFTKAEIDELRYIRDALQMALDDPESVLVDEAPRVREGRGASGEVGWTVEPGRYLAFNGRPFAHLDKEGTDTRPVEADGATHLIADLFNQNGVTPDTIYERHMGRARRPRR